MRIAQIAPLYEDVPPKMYGGTERVVAHLCNGLVDRGHKVTLFATATSKTKATLWPCRDQGLRLDPDLSWDVPVQINQLLEVRDQVDDFDILHFHTGVEHFPLFTDVFYKTVTTMHGRQDTKDLRKLYDRYNFYPLVSVSDNQRLPYPKMKWLKTVYHGYPLDQYKFTNNPKGDYLAFLGRCCPEKGLDKAIDIAQKAGIQLRIAAKIDPIRELIPTNRKYMDEEIKPLLDEHKEVDYVGEIYELDKSEFLGNALGTLFTTTGREPFGLVMIESFACGTPVIAFNKGSVPEILDQGVTGYRVDNVDQAVLAVKELSSLNRWKIRRNFETRFSLDNMIDGYESVYNKLKGV